jgi:hypothetical protein
MTTIIHFIISRSFLLRTRNVSDESCREYENIHFEISNFFRKWCRLRENVGKYCGVKQATDDYMANAHCLLEV